MSKPVVLKVAVEIADDANPDVLAEALFEFLASDPDDLFSAIEVVNNFGCEPGDDV